MALSSTPVKSPTLPENRIHAMRVFAMHTGRLPWSRLLEMLEKVTKG